MKRVPNYRQVQLDSSGERLPIAAQLGIKAGDFLTHTTSIGGLCLLALQDSHPLWLLQDVLAVAQARLNGLSPALAAAKLHYPDIPTVDAAMGYFIHRVCQQKAGNPLIMQALQRQEGQLPPPVLQFLQLHCHSPLQVRFTVTSGPDYLHPLLNRTFASGSDFQQAVEDLCHMPCRNAATYSCTVIRPPKWRSKTVILQLIQAKRLQPKRVLFVDISDSGVQVRVEESDSNGMLNLVSSLSPQYEYGLLRTVNRSVRYPRVSFLHPVLLARRLSPDYRPAPRQPELQLMKPSLAQSLLQKSVRRMTPGTLEMAALSLHHTDITQCADSANSASSGTRRLLWRLAVAALQDAAPFPGLENLFALALVAQFDMRFRLSANLFLHVLRLGLLLCQQAERWQCPSLLPQPEWKCDSLLRQVGDSLFQHMPCLNTDLDLLVGLLVSKEEDVLVDLALPVMLSPLLLSSLPEHLRDVHQRSQGTLLAAHDPHSDPSLILLVQAEHPHLPGPGLTTLDIADVWTRLLSSYNLRSGSSPAQSSTDPVLKTIQQVQAGFAAAPLLDWPPQEATTVSSHFTPPGVSACERRESFLSLFGQTHNLSKGYRVTLCGSEDEPLLVQAATGADPWSRLSGAKRKRGEEAWLQGIRKGWTVRIPPAPLGRHWTLNGDHASLLVTSTASSWTCTVNGQECPLFDASPFLDCHPSSLRVLSLQPARSLLLLCQECLYLSPPLHFGSLCEVLSNAVTLNRDDPDKPHYQLPQDAVWNWLELAQQSPLPGAVWGSLLAKVMTSERPLTVGSSMRVDIHCVTRKGQAQDRAVSYQYEGVLLRLLCLMCLLYPNLFTRTGKLYFKMKLDHPSFFHWQHCLTQLLRQDSRFYCRQLPVMNYDGGRGFAWPHQVSTQERVLQAVEAGCAGLADASSPGSGKTASALACGVALLERNRTHGVASHGILFVVPTLKLVESTVEEIRKHTLHFTVLTQEKSGVLQLVSQPTEPDNQCRLDNLVLRSQAATSSTYNGHSIVVTTLNRLRAHPFDKPWTLVIVDECLHIQNERALQSAEVWRQVVRSQCVLLLSATFFRSSYKKLFYLVRLFRSPIPATEPFLLSLLQSRIVCHVPKERRPWRVTYDPVPLPSELRLEYDQQLQDNRKSGVVAKFTSATQLLNRWSPVQQLVDIARRLQAQGRRPLIFASNAKEKAALLQELGSSKTGPCTVLTVREGAHGLNLQHDCDALVTRPQPGDQLEQMKGRIDRPGQRQQELVLVMVFAKDTVEEVAAMNVRLCDGFVRQYLHPLSTEYQALALGGHASARSIVESWQL